MTDNKFEQKLQFRPYSPYGYCSKTATIAAERASPFARKLVLGKRPKEMDALILWEQQRTREKQNTLSRKTTPRIQVWPAAYLRWKEVFGAAKLAVLVEPLDETMVSSDEERGSVKDINGNIKVTHFRSQFESSDELRYPLNAYGNDISKNGQALFKETLYNTVTSAKATLSHTSLLSCRMRQSTLRNTART